MIKKLIWWKSTPHKRSIIFGTGEATTEFVLKYLQGSGVQPCDPGSNPDLPSSQLPCADCLPHVTEHTSGLFTPTITKIPLTSASSF